MVHLTRLMVIAGWLAVVVSCRTDRDVTPQNNEFPVAYHFVNQSPDPLRALNFTVSTYFPKIDRTNVYYRNFQNLAPGDSANIVIDTTTATKSLAYAGCAYQLEIDVRHYVTPRLLHVSVWTTKRKEIRNRADANVKFNWPTDTLTADRVSSEYIQL